MVFESEESSLPAKIEGGSMDSGSDDEVLEIYSFTQCFFHEGKKEEIEKKDVSAQYFLPTSIERRIPP